MHRMVNVTTRPLIAGDSVVFIATWAARRPAPSLMLRVLPQLKPYLKSQEQPIKQVQ